MFDIGSSELLMIVVVAVVVIGPKDLPRALYRVGQIVGKARAMSRHFRSGIDAMIREAEMEEMERKWAADNRRIMTESPSASAVAEASEAEDVTASADPSVQQGDADAHAVTGEPVAGALEKSPVAPEGDGSIGDGDRGSSHRNEALEGRNS